MVLKDPVGPVAAFTPWNFPINQVVRKLAARWPPAARSSSRRRRKRRPAPAALVRAFADAGVPPGVLGLVYGNPAEISSYLIPHPVIRKITFTGSTPVGKQLAALAGPAHEARDDGAGRPRAGDRGRGRRHRAGGQGAGAAKFRNAGQVCISPTRFLVHEASRGDFAPALAKHAQG
jgi:succinate-semialdehyde dehydrogenase / glutarate-semialdehyde dehydrogenase